MNLSRRTMLEGLGSALVTAFAPAPVLAALPSPMRSLEEILGPKRMERVRQVWCSPEWIALRGEVLDRNNRFQMDDAYRRGLTAILNGAPAVEIIFDDASTYTVDCTVLQIVSESGLLPPDLGWTFTCDSTPTIYRLRFTVQDAWRELGWPEPPESVQATYRPLREWVMGEA
jgi:hypothetical protein